MGVKLSPSGKNVDVTVSDNTVPRSLYGPKTMEKIMWWEALYVLFTENYWGNMSRIGELGGAYKILVGNLKGRGNL